LGFGAKGVGEGLGRRQVLLVGLCAQANPSGSTHTTRRRNRGERTPRTASVNKLIGNLFCFNTTAYGSLTLSFKFSLK
jgi:hypothetical protein